MTRIDLDLRHDVIGGTATLAATLTAHRTRIRRDGAVLIYPDRLRFTLPGTITLDPPAAGEAWIIEVFFPDRRDTIYRTVTFQGAAVTWADLIDVDPSTLQPSIEPPAAAWTAALGAYLKKPVVLTAAAYDALTPTQRAAPTLFLITD